MQNNSNVTVTTKFTETTSSLPPIKKREGSAYILKGEDDVFITQKAGKMYFYLSI